MFVSHIAVYVTDLDRVRDFYVRYFQALPSLKYLNPKTSFQSCFLTFGEGARMELMTRENLKSMDRTLRLGYDHFAFALESSEQVDALAERLRQDGIPVLSGPRTTGDGFYECCFEDPEGNLVEITA